MPEQSDAMTFKQFERRGWQTVASQYHDHFHTLTTQTIPALLDAVLDRGGARPGQRLLDMATGPGYVAGAAKQRVAGAFGVDFSGPMAALAAAHYPDACFTVGDVEQLPFASESFDAVVTNFGLLHLAKPEQALSEAYRVLRVGGRIGFTVWARQETVAFGIVLRAIEAHGNPNAPLPPGPPFFRFSDPQECADALAGAGFRSPATRKVPQIWRLHAPEELFEIMVSATVRTGGLLRAQSAESLQAIRAAMAQGAKQYEKNGVIEMSMPAILASAVK